MILVTDVKAGLALTVEKLAAFQANLTDLSIESVVTFTGDTAYATWEPVRRGLRITINFPAMPDEGRLSRAEADRLTGYVLHELGHVFHTDLACFKQQAAISPFRKMLLNGLEDPRIEDAVIHSGQAPGARHCLTVLAQSLLSSLSPSFDAGDIRQAPFIIAVLGRVVRWGLPLPAGTFKIPATLAPFYALAMDGLRAAPLGTAGTHHLVGVVDQLMDWLKQREQQQQQQQRQQRQDGQPQPQQDGQQQGQQQGQQEGQQQGQSSVQTDPVQQQTDASATEGEGAGGADGLTESEIAPVEPDGAVERLAERLAAGSGVLDTLTRAKVREWAYAGDATNFSANVSSVGARIGQLTTTLGRLLVSPERCGWDTQRQSGRFDVRRSTRAMAGSESVFRQRWERPGLTTDVLLLVDWSGSMNRGRNVAAVKCSCVLAAALDRLNGVSFAAYGFTDSMDGVGQYGGEGMRGASENSHHRTHVPYIAPIKRFDEPLSQAKGKLATPRAADNTPDAECIKLAADILRRRDASRRVMIVLTDGRGDNGPEATLAAVKYAERAGVEMIGIGIQSDVVSAYPTSIVVHSVSDLTGRAMTVLVNRLSAKYLTV